MLSRRSLLLTAPTALLAAKPVMRVGASTNSLSVDPKNFETLVAAVLQLKQLGFEGFETAYQNVREQFGQPNSADERLRKTGVRFAGMQLALKTYDPQTGIAPWPLVQACADG